MPEAQGLQSNCASAGMPTQTRCAGKMGRAKQRVGPIRKLADRWASYGRRDEPDVLTLQAAINYGVREAFPRLRSVQEIVDSIPTPENRSRSQRTGQPVQ